MHVMQFMALITGISTHFMPALCSECSLGYPKLLQFMIASHTPSTRPAVCAGAQYALQWYSQQQEQERLLGKTGAKAATQTVSASST